MKILIETSTGNHTFTGDNLEIKTRETLLTVSQDGQTIAAFKNWQSWKDETK